MLFREMAAGDTISEIIPKFIEVFLDNTSKVYNKCRTVDFILHKFFINNI